jgi:hypothetical protein
MKTLTTLLITLLLSTSTNYAQQQMLNPGFEEWEDVGVGVDEPVRWSSIKTSDNINLNAFAPIVWGKSTDAHSGSYSLSLFNVYVSLINHVASGTITNGRVHAELDPDAGYVFTDQIDERWHGVLTDRPDSIVGWYKCNPSLGDFGTVKFFLHTGYAALPGDESNAIAEAYIELPSVEVTQWTRFSAPFVYVSSDNPEYFLTVITSGNGVDAIDGSTALYDDFEFIYNPSSVDELPKNQIEVSVRNQQLNILIGGNKQKTYELCLFDIAGHTILKQQITSGENNIINVNDIQSGVYIVSASNSRKTITKKVVIN